MSTAFLIEGFTACAFREIAAAKALAEANKATLFDAIESYSAKHLTAALKQLDQKQWPLLALACMVDFRKESSPQKIIDTIIKPAFEQLVSDKIIAISPPWLSELNDSMTIANFIQTQMVKHFKNSADAFKAFSRTLYEMMLKISNDLSSANLLSFLTKNPEIKYIYALLGKIHIKFADQLTGAKVIAEDKNTRTLTIALGDRSITLEIHAGTHGEMDHFESLQQSCKGAGLVIPEVSKEEPSIDINTVADRLLATFMRGSEPGTAASAGLTFFKPAESMVFDLDKAAAKFDYWMKKYRHPAEKSNGEHLVRWLYYDYGAQTVSKYEDFCRLAEKLNTMGYNISPLPEKTEFDKGITEFKERDAGGIVFDLDKAAAKFDSWMKRYKQFGEKSNGESLLEWLCANKGAQMVSRYEDFCRLTEKLNTMGYNISPLPEKTEFETAIAKFKEQKAEHEAQLSYKFGR